MPGMIIYLLLQPQHDCLDTVMWNMYQERVTTLSVQRGVPGVQDTSAYYKIIAPQLNRILKLEIIRISEKI